LISYNTNNLQKFDAVFRHSNFVKDMDSSDQAVLSTTATIKLKRSLIPTLAAATKYTVNFNNAAYHPAASWTQTIIESTGFYLSGNSNIQYIDDNGSGILRTFYLLGGTAKTYTNETAGTIDYTTGTVVLTSFNVTGVSNSDGTISITLKPDSNDVIPVRSQIVELDTVESTVTAEVDTFAEGTATAGVGYTTNSSTASVGSVYSSS